MQRFLLVLVALVAAVSSAPGQQVPPPIDSLINVSLDWFDLPVFEFTEPLDAPKARFGVYTQEVPQDSLRMMAGFPSDRRGFRLWHVTPNWSADLGGLYIGDIVFDVEGRPVGDSIYPSPDDYINAAARDRNVGDSMHVGVYRDGKPIIVAVPLRASVRALAQPEPPGRLGPIRASWLGRQIERLALGDWATTIRKQIRSVADADFNTVAFGGRANPWRLRAVTYLDYYPMRTGAYSRMIVKDIWDAQDRGPGLSEALLAAGRHLDIDGVALSDPRSRPETLEMLKAWLDRTQQVVTRAYAGIDKPGEVAAELASMLDMETESESALEKITDRIERRAKRVSEEHRVAEVFDRAEKLDRAALLQAGAMLGVLADTTVCRALGADIARTAPRRTVNAKGATGDILMQWTSASGRCVVGGSGDNTYEGDFALIIDLGGNDRYQLDSARPATVRLVMDLGGDDDYRSARSGQAAGIGAVDALLDLAGNDVYQAVSWSQGSGVLGIGLLADFAGDDLYRGRWCVQGTGFLGIGMLFDGAGADNYIADVYSQAFAYARGFGALMDESGNDSYRAGWKYEDSRIPHRAHLAMSQGFGFGMRPWGLGVNTDGGIGMLADRAGDDLYASDFFSQGGSYWYALGILYDRQGADRYTAGQYSQGSGIHLSFAALLDDAGDDMYDAYAALEQGNAHDWSAGCLEDFQGNDTYRATGAAQGSALTVSFAWLLDSHGNDAYYAALSDTTLSQGGGNLIPARKGGSLGLLLDIGRGKDYYVEPRATPGTAIVKGNRGILYDDGE